MPFEPEGSLKINKWSVTCHLRICVTPRDARLSERFAHAQCIPPVSGRGLNP